MVFSTQNFYKTFELVRKRIPYKLVIKSINPDEIILRSNIKDLKEATLFIEAYQVVTESQFKLSTPKSLMNRSVCRRKWSCSLSRGKPLIKCPAKITILIKKNNKYNKMNDAFLRRSPPFRAVIKINPNHDHPPPGGTVVTAPPGKLLKVNEGVKNCFYEYFKRGFIGTRAKCLHEFNLRKANFHALDDASMNPALPTIFALHKNWLKMKENVEVNKVVASENSVSVPASNVEKSETVHTPPNNSFIDMKAVICKYEIESDDDEYSSQQITDQHIEDIKPVLNIKKEIEECDNNDGLPVISSYGSLATPPPVPPPPVAPPKTKKISPKNKALNTKAAAAVSAQNVTTVVRVVQPPQSKIVVYDQSSNTYKVVKCLSVNPKYITGDYSTSQYNSYLPSALLPTRISLQK